MQKCQLREFLEKNFTARLHTLTFLILVVLRGLDFRIILPCTSHIFSYNLLVAQSYCVCSFLTFRGILTHIAHSFRALRRNGSNFVVPYRQNTGDHQRHKYRGHLEQLKYKIIENQSRRRKNNS